VGTGTEPDLTAVLGSQDGGARRRILVVADERTSANLAAVLERAGYEARVEHRRPSAPLAVREWWPDFVVLDLRLDALEGLEACRGIRAGSTVPILILARRDGVVTRMRALEAGADACLSEPFSFDELLARLRAALRRTPFSTHDERLEICDLVVDVGRHEVTRGGRPIELTARQFDLLEFLVRHQGQVVTRSQICSAVWGSTDVGTSNVLTVHIHALRQKLDADFEPKLIHTVHGLGYRLRLPRRRLAASSSAVGLGSVRTRAPESPQPVPQRHTETDMTGPRVLIVEDDHELRGVLVRGLQEEGFRTEAFGSGAEFLTRAVRSLPDALVVDIGLPDADGRDLCHALRAQGQQVPVLFLTARDALPDRLSGFRAGGDDYMTKPFAFEELVVRLQALLRRSAADAPLEAAGLVLDPVRRTASVDGASVTLTPTEFRLLACLLAAPSFAVVRRRDLIRAAWPEGAIVHENTLDAYVLRVRRKLRGLPGAPRVATMRSVGYRIE
jgi:two-component system response regulator MprA